MSRFPWKTTALSAILAISLTACGGAKPDASNSGSAEPASKYPEKPITVVAPSGAGGGWDKTARSLTKILGETKLVGQTMTVENKPGGGGAVYMAEYATKEVKNPYILLVNSPPILINNLKSQGNSPYGYQNTTPLAQLTKDFGAIVVAANSPYNDIQSLMKDMKADPKKLTVAGGSAPGSMDHLIAVLPAYKSGVDPKAVKYVSYDGGGEAIAALLGSNADVIATDASAVGQYLKSGKVKVLAVTSTERLKGDLKDVPTLKESGIDVDFTIWRGVFGPKEMSKDELAYWEKTLKALSEKEEWKKELQANGWESEYRGSADFTKFLGEQEKLIKELLSALGMAK
ncbi:Bug family tripartite tricarboxylate transporter substrate binding protein [Paenibacillus turpanensis]|uniref:Bug family tripartite tricarboxylate transporter substrate binding protein n=1 Tax=Paenibacillus turpanensis TaxID=2689078 RepID=UPI001408EE1D|nr:tripartite tricarboxylate transporter substrate binding protein [Paenibacillus turpanensis]